MQGGQGEKDDPACISQMAVLPLKEVLSGYRGVSIPPGCVRNHRGQENRHYVSLGPFLSLLATPGSAQALLLVGFSGTI